MSVAPVDFGAPPVPRPAWFPAAARRFADAPAGEVLAWAVRTFGSDLTVASSMQDGVLVDLAVRADPDVEVVFIDTGFHFAETLETARRLQAHYRLNLVTLRPEDGAPTFRTMGTEACCSARKVDPLEQYLAERAAWITGLRRAESPSRAGAATLEWDAARGLVKINPLVAWTDDDVAAYVAAHDIIVNPLRHNGFDSIGCAPCTLPGAGRCGRWAGSDRLECGLHLVAEGG
ncbi:MAG TPA: phosphoadenylyl-sulfate reductase [Acidimicrobiia bacterium]|nr:phosphoadenylyl-sulfate reductase [Acidimicrobiia bacterium]